MVVLAEGRLPWIVELHIFEDDPFHGSRLAAHENAWTFCGTVDRDIFEEDVRVEAFIGRVALSCGHLRPAEAAWVCCTEIGAV